MDKLVLDKNKLASKSLIIANIRYFSHGSGFSQLLFRFFISDLSVALLLVMRHQSTCSGMQEETGQYGNWNLEPLHSATCALLSHREQQCNTENQNNN